MSEFKNKTAVDPLDSKGATNLNFMQLLTIIWDSRKFIGIFTGSITALAVIFSLLMSNTYKSTAVVLPDTDKSKLASMGGLSDLAALAGVNVGGDASIIRLFPAYIKSESILKNVIFSKYKSKEFPDSVNLIQYWEIKTKTPERDYELALQVLRDAIVIITDPKTNLLSMSLETFEPQLSADILNNVIFEMDKFIRTKKNTSATEQRKWIESRLNEVKIDLDNSENTLKNFREKNRIVIGSPQLLLEQERLAREVQINSAIYVELKKQSEIAKIEEVKSVKVISVLDYPRPAAKKEGPKRGIIVISTFMLSFIGSSSYRLIKHSYGEKISQFYGQIRKLIFRK
jgi:uncharacterized protein involved in exopolysaccharide biosynthesis